MAFSTKSTISTAAATNTITGWSEPVDTWEVTSGGTLAKKSGAGDNYLVCDYSTTNVAGSNEGNQRIKFRFTAGGGLLTFLFRYSAPGGSNQSIYTYWGLSNNIRVDYNLAGEAAVNQSSSSWGLTNGVDYDAVVQVVGTGASTVYTATIYNTGGTQVFQFILGSGGTAWTDSTKLVSTGDFRFLGNAGVYKPYVSGSTIIYESEGTAPTPTQTIVKTSTSSSTQLVVTPSGGVGSLTVSVKLADGTTEAPGSPQTVSTGTPITFDRTGLTAAYHYVYYVTTTDEAAQSVSEGVDIFTRQANVPTAIRVVGVGDSITVGPTTTNRPTYNARDIIAEVLGVSGTSAQEATVATGGYSSGQIASLADVVVDVVNGVSNADSNITGASLPLAAPADLVVIRLGKNDNDSTAAETAANIQAVIDAIRAGCAHNPWILLLPITGYPGSGAEGAMSTDRQYAVYDLLAAKEDVADRILIGRRLSWWMFVWNPSYLPDSVHPQAAQIDILAQEIAWAYFDRILPASVPGDYIVGSGSDSGSGGGSLEMGSPVRLFDDCVEYTPSDTALVTSSVQSTLQMGFYVEVGGNVKIQTMNGTTTTIALPSNGAYYGRVLKIFETDTTATGIFLMANPVS